MNPNPNTSGLRPFARGTSGNPAGRPRSLLTSLKVREIIGRFFMMPCRDVEAIASDESAPAGEAIVAAVMMRIFRDGDANRLRALLDRAVGLTDVLLKQMPLPARTDTPATTMGMAPR